jgi:hypothetical protein
VQEGQGEFRIFRENLASAIWRDRRQLLDSLQNIQQLSLRQVTQKLLS